MDELDIGILGRGTGMHAGRQQPGDLLGERSIGRVNNLGLEKAFSLFLRSGPKTVALPKHAPVSVA
jgi:hypothetical protein